MADRLELAFLREAERSLGLDAQLAVAVSGGGDSVALLHLVERWTRGRGSRPWVLHLDHALRPDSSADREFVEALAAGLGLPCHAERRDVREKRRRDESPEEAARRVRRRFLREAAAEVGAAKIVLGHTLDDQAETILMRLARGAGARALAAMSPCGPGPWVRPLLGVERSELRSWLTRHGLSWRDDPTNEDPAFDRNRVRRLLIPEIQRSLNPRASRHFVRAAAMLEEDAALLDAMAERKLREALAAGTDQHIASIDARRLATEPAPIARRMARMALDLAGVDARRASSRHVEALLRLAAAPAGKQLDLPGGWTARRTATHVVIEPLVNRAALG